MRRSDTYLMNRLGEIESLIDQGCMDGMTDGERDQLGQRIRDLIAELLDLESPAQCDAS